MIKRELYGYLKEMTNGSLRIEKIVLNSGFTGVALDSGDMGIAMNVRTGSSVSGKISDFLQGKINVEALSVAADILKYIDSSGGFPEGSPAEKHLVHSVLVALYNALSKPFMKNEYLGTIGGRVEYNASKTSKSPSGEVKPGEIVTIVGFGGMVRSISQTAKETYVTELEPDLFSATLFSARGAVQGPDCCTIIPSSAAEECFK